MIDQDTRDWVRGWYLEATGDDERAETLARTYISLMQKQQARAQVPVVSLGDPSMREHLEEAFGDPENARSPQSVVREVIAEAFCLAVAEQTAPGNARKIMDHMDLPWDVTDPAPALLREKFREGTETIIREMSQRERAKLQKICGGR